MWLQRSLGKPFSNLLLAQPPLHNGAGVAAATSAITAPSLCGCSCWEGRCWMSSGGGWKKPKFLDRFLNPEDRNKRPSDLEIKKKDLPPNQPTLAERVERDRDHLFHQTDRKHGYRSLSKYPDTYSNVKEELMYGLRHRPKETIKQSFQLLGQEVVKWGEEVKDGFRVQKNLTECWVQPGDVRKEWGFQSELDMFQWVLTKDSDWGEGYSSAEFNLNSQGTAGVLRGELSTRVPADGRTQYAGYVNIASVPQRESFAREKILMYWENYTHLTMNVRGDGRKYMLNLKVKRDYDMFWDDRWHFPLFTRGGPYWQHVKIPFSKFYFGSKGVLQDKQGRIPQQLVVGMSLTLKDRISGPFQLEIKDVSLLHDPSYDDEEFAYEMYKTPAFWAHY